MTGTTRARFGWISPATARDTDACRVPGGGQPVVARVTPQALNVHRSGGVW
ncbi:hypothetical protein [Salinigranum marinum]|uniref:hypothetical protein n=1 Tax=Salinigranum marinum TaxID=1515595 RepID=UPI002989C2B6|nr:hypothetical protein [Salinigranum marinum]